MKKNTLKQDTNIIWKEVTMNEHQEKKARKIAIWVIFIMIGIWIVFGFFSFVETPTRTRPHTTEVFFEGQSALQGKKVFQAYNCMDCHTMVGNGAYFAPDLTKIYEEAGPAWLKAYLGSPGTYPTEAIVNLQLQQLIKSGNVHVADLNAYYDKFKAAKRRVVNRGGKDALMPNLRFKPEEISSLIAFFKYTSMLNTAGWPPKVIARPAVIEQERRKLEEESGMFDIGAVNTSQNAGANAANPETKSGRMVAEQLACTACHSTDGSVKVGPSWKGLFGSNVALADGKTVVADSAYIVNSVTDPDLQITKGFQKGVMPSFKGVVTDQQLSQLLTYIKSLK